MRWRDLPHGPKPSLSPQEGFYIRSLQTITLVLLAIHLVHGLVRTADYDEFQTLVNAVLSVRGSRIYVDFWDNHGPLINWLLVPVVDAWKGGHELLIWLRGGVWLNTAALSALVFYTVRGLLKNTAEDLSGGVAPYAAVIMMLSAPSFLAKSIELRPDNPATLCGTTAVVALLRGLRTGHWKPYLLAGVTLGIMAGFTLKVLMFALGLVFFGFGYLLRKGPMPEVRNVVAFIGGLVATTGVFALIILSGGGFVDFLQCYGWENIQRPSGGVSSSELTRITKRAPFWAILAVVTLGLALWRMFRGKALPVEAGLAMMIVALVLQFVFLLPTRYYQSLLPVYPLLAILTGLTVSRLPTEWLREVGRKRLAVVAGGIILLGLLLRDMHDFANLRNRHLRAELQFADQAAEMLGERNVFDPGGRVFLHYRTGRYPVLVKHFRREYQAGRMDLGLREQLDSAGGVVMDSRTLDLPDGDLLYIKENFGRVLENRNAELWMRPGG